MGTMSIVSRGASAHSGVGPVGEKYRHFHLTSKRLPETEAPVLGVFSPVRDATPFPLSEQGSFSFYLYYLYVGTS